MSCVKHIIENAITKAIIKAYPDNKDDRDAIIQG